MKTGRETTISVRVYRAAEGRWYDLGPVHTERGTWGDWLEAIVRRGASIAVRFRYNGRDYERAAD